MADIRHTRRGASPRTGTAGATDAGAGLQIVRGDAGDAAAAGALAAASLAEAWSAADTERWLERPGGALWLARLAGETVGALWLGIAADEGEILSLVVAPSRRRAGIGVAMVRAALEGAASEGARIAHLEVRASNAAARALYAGLGFEVAGRRPRYYRDGEDALLLSRPLPLEARPEPGEGGR